MKDSIAVALRHSRKQADRTYDRRTRTEKKQPALEFARSLAQKNSEPTRDLTATPPHRAKEPQFEPGDFVGLVEEGSTLSDPCILLGRVLYYVSETRVALLWYKTTSFNTYDLAFEGDNWIEDESCLVPVKVCRTKKRPGFYSLLTAKRTVHKAVHSSDAK